MSIHWYRPIRGLAVAHRFGRTPCRDVASEPGENGLGLGMADRVRRGGAVFTLCGIEIWLRDALARGVDQIRTPSVPRISAGAASPPASTRLRSSSSFLVVAFPVRLHKDKIQGERNPRIHVKAQGVVRRLRVAHSSHSVETHPSILTGSAGAPQPMQVRVDSSRTPRAA
jgi:hypothetical protein